MAVARVTELTASAARDFHDAFQAGIPRASATLRNITGAEIVTQKAKIENGEVSEYRMRRKITFISE